MHSIDPHTELRQRLDKLGIRGVSAALDDLLARANEQRMTPMQLLEAAVDVEQRDRKRRSLERRTKRARIGHFKPATDFDWSWPSELDRDLLDRALKLGFVEEGANVVLLGPHGVGKTTLLKNICHQAVMAGHTVLFTTASKLLGDLTATDSPSVLHRRLKHYCRMAVLAIDELGYLSYDQRAADLLFEIVTRRHADHKSVLISTNLPFKEWNTVFPNATCTVALVDRLTHRADVIKIQGESWRRKEALERKRRRTTPA